MSFAQKYATKQLGVLEYKGSWNASTNVPTISSSTGDKGDYYIVSMAGNTDIDGQIDWQPGDWIVFSGQKWQKIDNSETSSVINSINGGEIDKSPSVSAVKTYIDAADGSLDSRLDDVESHLSVQTLTFFENTPSVYADGFAGIQDSSFREGWYFKNTTQGQKINWYFYDGVTENLTLGNFSCYAIITFDSIVSKPFFAIYTTKTGSGDAGSWYKSRIVAIPVGSAVVGVKYLMYYGQDPKVHPELPRLATELSTSTVGTKASSERVYTASLGSDSGTAANNCQFISEALGVFSPTIKRKLQLRIRKSSQAGLDAEAALRSGSDNTLQTNINTVSTNLSLEIINRTTAVTTVQNALNSEVTRATTKENQLELLAQEAKDRSFHIGTQLSNTISDFVESVHDSVTSLFDEGPDVSIVYPNENGKIQAVLNTTGVTPGVYNTVTIDNKGRVIAASNSESGQVAVQSYVTTQLNTTTLTSFSDIAGLNSTNLLSGVYKFTFMCLAQSTSTGTGIGVKLVAKTASISTIYAKYAITQSVPGTTQSYEYDQISQNTNVTSTSASSTSFGFVIRGEGVVRVTNTGILAMQFRSEVADSAVSVNEDAVLILEKL